MRNQYTMVFALTPTLKHVLLLKKPHSHHNPMFRDRWTAPGGLIETSETVEQGARRELHEETGLLAIEGEMLQVLQFCCNCDPSEQEHDVFVFGLIVPIERLRVAKGSIEPVKVFSVKHIAVCQCMHYRPHANHFVWSTKPLLDLIIARMTQPREWK